MDGVRVGHSFATADLMIVLHFVDKSTFLTALYREKLCIPTPTPAYCESKLKIALCCRYSLNEISSW